MANHSSTLGWRIPWTEEPGRLQSMGSLGVDTTEWLHFHFSLSCIGEGNGNLLQYSCLEDPRDGGAWWVVIYGVTQSQTWLKQWSSSSNILLFRQYQLVYLFICWWHLFFFQYLAIILYLAIIWLIPPMEIDRCSVMSKSLWPHGL